MEETPMYAVIIEEYVERSYGCNVRRRVFADIISMEKLYKILEKHKEKLCTVSIWLIMHSGGLVETNNLRSFCEEVDYEHSWCEELESEEEE